MAEILITDLTESKIDGNGIFDELMTTSQVRLDAEYGKNRIRGTDYSKVYLGAMEATLAQSIAFLLGKQQADKQAELLEAQKNKTISEDALVVKQTDKTTSDIALVDQQVLNLVQEELVLKQDVLKSEAEVLLMNAKADNEVKSGLILDETVFKTIAETKLLNAKADAEDLRVEILELEKQKLAIELTIAEAQKLKIDAEVLLLNQKASNAITEGQLLTKQIDKVIAETKAAIAALGSELSKIHDQTYIDKKGEIGGTLYTVVGLAGKQKDKLSSEKFLLDQKKTTEIAQTSNSVTQTTGDFQGIVGAQKALYVKQKDGFDRNAEAAMAKIMGDNYAVRRGTNENEDVPDSMADPKIDLVINAAATGAINSSST